MAISDNATKSAMASAYAGLCTHAAAHSANPATSGNELNGAGSARGAISWGAPTNGVITGTATVTLPTSGPNTVDAIGLWSASSGGTFRDGQYDVTNVQYSGAGTANISITYTQT